MAMLDVTAADDHLAAEEVDYGENEEPLHMFHELEADAAADASEGVDAATELVQQEAGGSLVAQTSAAPPTLQQAPQVEQARMQSVAGSALPATSGTEEWERMDVPDGWRPLPLMRVWGVAKQATEEELLGVLREASVGDVRSVAFDPRAETVRGKVAFVRLHPPPLPWLAAAGNGLPPEADAFKVAEGVVAGLRAKQPPLQLYGQDLHVERTMAEVTLFLANLTVPEDELRQRCAVHGTMERCFVMRNPAGQSKGYGFVEYSVPSAAAACREAWLRAAEVARPARDPTGGRYEKVKLARAEAATIRTVAGLFAASLFVDNLPAHFVDLERLKRIFSAHGEVTHVGMPRNINNPEMGRGFAFVHFRHSHAADAAWRALDNSTHEGIGRLVVSMSNPAKASDPQRQPGMQSAAGSRGSQQAASATSYGGRSGPAGRGGRGGGRGGGSTGRGDAGGQEANGGHGRMVAGAGRVVVPLAGGIGMPGAGMLMAGGPAAMLQSAAPLAMQQQAVMMQQLAMQRQMAMQQVMMMAAKQQEQEAAMAQMMAAQKELEAQRKAEAEAAEKARQEAEYARRMAYGFALASSAAAGAGGLASSGNAMPGGMGLAGVQGLAAGMGGMASLGMPGGMAALGGAMPGAMGAAALMGGTGMLGGQGMLTAGLGMQQQQLGTSAAANEADGGAAGNAYSGAYARGGGRGGDRYGSGQDDRYGRDSERGYSHSGREGGYHGTSKRYQEDDPYAGYGDAYGSYGSAYGASGYTASGSKRQRY